MHRRNYLMQAIKVNYDNLEDIQIISPKTVFICKKCIIYIRWHRYINKQWMTSLVNIFFVQYWKENRGLETWHLMSSNILTLSTIMNYTEYDYNSISRETNLENEYSRILQICKYIRDIYMSIAFAKILMNVDRITYYIPYKQPIILIHWTDAFKCISWQKDLFRFSNTRVIGHVFTK